MLRLCESSTHHLDLLTPLRLFNTHSRDPRDHFKLVPLPDGASSELRLCSEHPQFVRCIVQGDTSAVHVRGDGPDRLRVRYDLGREQEDLGAVLGPLLALLQERRGEGRELMDWECEDWVGAGYPCRLREECGEGSKVAGLGFGADDLWCVDAFPSVWARLPAADGAAESFNVRSANQTDAGWRAPNA